MLHVAEGLQRASRAPCHFGAAHDRLVENEEAHVDDGARDESSAHEERRRGHVADAKAVEDPEKLHPRGPEIRPQQREAEPEEEEGERAAAAAAQGKEHFSGDLPLGLFLDTRQRERDGKTHDEQKCWENEISGRGEAHPPADAVHSVPRGLGERPDHPRKIPLVINENLKAKKHIKN